MFLNISSKYDDMNLMIFDQKHRFHQIGVFDGLGRKSEVTDRLRERSVTSLAPPMPMGTALPRHCCSPGWVPKWYFDDPGGHFDGPGIKFFASIESDV